MLLRWKEERSESCAFESRLSHRKLYRFAPRSAVIFGGPGKKWIRIDRAWRALAWKSQNFLSDSKGHNRSRTTTGLPGPNVQEAVVLGRKVGWGEAKSYFHYA